MWKTKKSVNLLAPGHPKDIFVECTEYLRRCHIKDMNLASSLPCFNAIRANMSLLLDLLFQLRAIPEDAISKWEFPARFIIVLNSLGLPHSIPNSQKAGNGSSDALERLWESMLNSIKQERAWKINVANFLPEEEWGSVVAVSRYTLL